MAEGQVAEINLGIDRWAGEIAAALESGFVLTVDYGKTATQLYSAEERPDGTLTTYYRHTQTDDPFRHVGSQDITAQVDFTAVVQAGRAHGLGLVGYTRQSDFLRSLGLGEWQRRLGGLNLSQQQTQANLGRYPGPGTHWRSGGLQGIGAREKMLASQDSGGSNPPRTETKARKMI